MHPSSAVFLSLPAWFSLNPLLSYVTSVVLLAIGVSLEIKNAPAQTNWQERIAFCGPVFIAVPMALFGLDHFFFPAGVGRIIPAWIPAPTFWVYFVGTCLIPGGVCIV